jgi:diguanylate cyclase (GGDEF)-like protein
MDAFSTALSNQSGVMAGAAQRLLQDLDTSFLGGSQSDLLREVLRFAATAESEISTRQSRIQALEQVSLMDDQTGLENERGLRGAVDRAIAATARYDISHVVVLLAVGGLDDVASRYGRPAEQLAMQQLAQELRRRTRRSDVLARTSRHELAVLLSPCPAAHGASKAASLAATLGGMELRHQDQIISLQVSAGFAPVDADASYERVLAFAHQKLAKRWEPRFAARPAERAVFGRRGLIAPQPDSQ